MELAKFETPPALTPHQYPAWIWLMGLGILATLGVALSQLPPYYRAAALVKRAETLAEHQQDKDAVEFFANALAIAPSSKRARLGLALSCFRSPDEGDHRRGLDALHGVTLEKEEWEKLAAVMPAAYRSLFSEVKK